MESHKIYVNRVLIFNGFAQKYSRLRFLLRVKRLGDLFLFGLIWQYSSVQTKYNKGRFKVMATYLQQ